MIMKSLKFTIPVLLLVCISLLGQTFIKTKALAAEGNPGEVIPSITHLEQGVKGVISTPSQSNGGKTLPTTRFNDRYYERQWALQDIQLPSSSDLYQNPKRPVRVAILDSGIDRYHEDLQRKVVTEKNFTNSPSTADINGHGTHIAGIIAANTNNNLGIRGIAPLSEIYNIKVSDDLGKVYAKDLAEGINWAVQNGADVLNISIEIQEPTQELENAVNYAWENGALVVAAASNHTVDPVFPAYFSNCMAVAAIDQKSRIGPLVYNGDFIHIAAPGYSIYSTLPNNNYGYRSGTSFATAHVSGLAALLFGIAEDVNGNGQVNDEVRASIETAASTIAESGIKIIDAASSLAQFNNFK